METVQGLFSTVPLDYVFLGGFALLIALDTLRSGTGRASAIALAFPVAAVLFSYAKEAPFLGSAISSPMLEAVAFLALGVVLFFGIRRMGLEFVSNGMGQPVQAALAGVAATAVVAVIWMHVPALEAFWEFSPHIQSIFAAEFRLFWLLGAFGALAFARG